MARSQVNTGMESKQKELTQLVCGGLGLGRVIITSIQDSQDSKAPCIWVPVSWTRVWSCLKAQVQKNK